MLPRSVLALSLALLVALLAPPADAQYFGRNKVQYDNFDFRVMETEHFDVLFYPEAEQGVRDAARMAERWYTRLSAILGHEFRDRKSIILYADDADFRQTNVIGGAIGEGVQGVTEGFQLRVVMPLAGTYAATDHVLGHELIHQFQYDISQRSGQFNTFVRLPLWLIEGMAEYFSLGRDDAHTAMWMRDAVIRDAFPTIEQLSRDQRYFPYRYGQAFWAWIGGTYGDEAAVQLFRAALAMPLDSAVVSVTGLRPDSLSARWRADIEETYLPYIRGLQAPPYQGRDLARTSQERLDSLGLLPLQGRRVLARDIDAGDMNVSPQVSPDGRYVAFLSERDLFGIDLFLADAQTGRVIRRLQSVGQDPHLDAIRFIDSAGTWSPDGQRFAFVTFAQGRNEIAILDVATREIQQRIQISGVGAIKDPAWSPDGSQLAFNGIRGGISDLYLVDIAGGVARQLTQDRHAAMQPAWSPDGRYLAFASDRGPDTSFEQLTYSEMKLALYDTESRSLEVLNFFPGQKHINPHFSPDGESIYFVGARAGIPNVFRYHRPSGDLFQVTNLATGVSGISNLSPAISVASQAGTLMYSVFEAQGYSVYSLPMEQAQGRLIRPGQVAAAPQTPAVDAPGTDAPAADRRVLDSAVATALPPDAVASAAAEVARDPAAQVGETPAETPLPTDDPLELPVHPADADIDALHTESVRPAADTLRADRPGVDTLAVDEPVADTLTVEVPDDPDGLGTLLADDISLSGLPPMAGPQQSRVERYLVAARVGLPETGDFPDRDYRPRLRLDYVSQPTAGVGYDPYYGFGVGGGIAMRFSDTLGDNLLGVVVQANGTLKDIGGQVIYLNQRRRLNWGGGVTHIPILRVGLTQVSQQFADGSSGSYLTRIYERTYLTQVSGLTAYPLSQTRRLEANLGLRRIGYEFEIDVFNNQGQLRRESVEDVFPGFEAPDALYLVEGGGAFVGDYSFFGFTSPVRGGRYRFGLDAVTGSLSFVNATADYRRYFYTRPFFTFAFRGLHFGRYGPDADAPELQPIFLGNGVLVRGYSFGSFDTNQGFAATLPRLLGSRIGVASAEVRMPLLGVPDFGLINFPFLPTELALFADAGIAWGEYNEAFMFTSPGTQSWRTLSEQTPVASFGAAARVNLLGALVLEFYYARPIARPDGRTGVFGVNFSPGW